MFLIFLKESSKGVEIQANATFNIFTHCIVVVTTEEKLIKNISPFLIMGRAC